MSSFIISARLLFLLVLSIIHSIRAISITITSYSPKTGSLAGGLRVSFNGYVSENFDHTTTNFNIKFGTASCTVDENVFSTASLDSSNPSFLFSCITGPFYPSIDLVPAAVLADTSTFSTTQNLVASITPFNRSSITPTCSAVGGCNFKYDRTLTPTITGFYLTNYTDSTWTPLAGQRHTVVSNKYASKPLRFEASGKFASCSSIDCIERFYLGDSGLECLIRDGDTFQPYGYSFSGNTARISCLVFMSSPRSFLPSIIVSGLGATLYVPTNWTRDQAGNPSAYTLTPLITDYEPKAMSHRGGDTIKLSGHGLAPDYYGQVDVTKYDVYVGNVRCNVLNATFTELYCVLDSAWEEDRAGRTYTDPVKGVTVKWWDIRDFALFDPPVVPYLQNVFNPTQNALYPNYPDRWYMLPTFDYPIDPQSVLAQSAWLNQHDLYGKHLCADFLPPATGDYRFYFICQGSCWVDYTDPSGTQTKRWAYDNSNPNLGYMYWKNTPSQTAATPMTAGTKHRIEIFLTAQYQFDFVSVQVQYPNGTRLPIYQHVLEGCYEPSFATPLNNLTFFIGQRGAEARQQGKRNYRVPRPTLAYQLLDAKNGLPTSIKWIEGFSVARNDFQKPGDYYMQAYLYLEHDGDYSFNIAVTPPSGALLPEAELYITLDDGVTGPPRQELVAAAYSLSYLWTKQQTSRRISLKGRHPYLLQFFMADLTYDTTLSMTEHGATNKVYTPIPSSMLFAVETVPTVALYTNGLPATCNVTNRCIFKYEPIARDVQIPEILTKGTRMSFQLDTWSIKNIIGNEIMNIDGALCPLYNVNYTTRYISCELSQERFGGMVNLSRIVVGNWGYLDTRDFSSNMSYYALNTDQASFYRFVFSPGAKVVPYEVRVRIDGFGFISTVTNWNQEQVQVYINETELCVLESSNHKIMYARCPVAFVHDSYPLKIVQTYNGVVFTNYTDVAVDESYLYDRVLDFYGYSTTSATLVELTGNSLDSATATFDIRGSIFSDRLNTGVPDIWYNEVFYNSNTACTILNTTIYNIFAECTVSIPNLASKKVTTNTKLVGGVSKTSDIVLNYPAIYVDSVHMEILPPAVDTIRIINYDFSPYRSYRIFNVDFEIVGASFGRASSSASTPGIPSYHHTVALENMTDATDTSGVKDTVDCIVSETTPSTLRCRALVQVDESNLDFNVTIGWQYSNVQILDTQQSNFTFNYAEILERYAAWVEASKEPEFPLAAVLGSSLSVGFMAIGALGYVIYYKKVIIPKRTAAAVNPVAETVHLTL